MPDKTTWMFPPAFIPWIERHIKLAGKADKLEGISYQVRRFRRSSPSLKPDCGVQAFPSGSTDDVVVLQTLVEACLYHDIPNKAPPPLAGTAAPYSAVTLYHALQRGGFAAVFDAMQQAGI